MKSNQLADRIIDTILESPLNIRALPDDVERELYENIYRVVVEHIINSDNQSWCSRIRKYFN